MRSRCVDSSILDETPFAYSSQISVKDKFCSWLTCRLNDQIIWHMFLGAICNLRSLPASAVEILDWVSWFLSFLTSSRVQYRQYDRQTRRSITLRGLQQNLFCLPLCFTAVTELDITALIRMPEEFPLLNLPESSYLRLQKAFPHLRTLYTPAVNDDCIRILGRIWPRLTKLALSQHPISGLPPCLRTVLQAFKSMEDLDAQYLKCDQISGDFASRSKYGLRKLNLSRIIIRRDNELEVLADTCLELESLSVTVHPGLSLLCGSCFHSSTPLYDLCIVTTLFDQKPVLTRDFVYSRLTFISLLVLFEICDTNVRFGRWSTGPRPPSSSETWLQTALSAH